MQRRILKPLPTFGGDADLRALGETITRDILQSSPNVKFEQVVELDDAKRILREAVVMPLKYPQLFTGLLSPWCGILLYGPPGTGKTMWVRASEASALLTGRAGERASEGGGRASERSGRASEAGERANRTSEAGERPKRAQRRRRRDGRLPPGAKRKGGAVGAVQYCREGKKHQLPRATERPKPVLQGRHLISQEP
jgi:hypothetical protein